MLETLGIVALRDECLNETPFTLLSESNTAVEKQASHLGD